MSIEPFYGVLYDNKKDLGKLLAPPYDVLTQRLRDAYLKKHPNNIVHLDLQPELPNDDERSNRYTRAKALYSSWLSESILSVLPRKSFYIYTQSYQLDNVQFTRIGVVALVGVQSFQDGAILPHERTFEGPKEDRLKLLSALQAHLSQVFLLYKDPNNLVDNLYSGLSDKDPIAFAKDEENIIHKLYSIDDASAQDTIKELLSSKVLYIADGHHRLETAYNYSRIMRKKYGDKKGPYDYTLAFLCNMHQPGLSVMAYNRYLIPPLGSRIRNLLIEHGFNLQEYPVDRLSSRNGIKDLKVILNSLKKEQGFALALVSQKDNPRVELVTLKKPLFTEIVKGIENKGFKECVAKLDVTVVDKYIFDDLLGIEDAKKKDVLMYEKGYISALDELRSGRIDGAILLAPLSPLDVAEVSDENERMPQKSTYFYPKLLTGLIIYDYERSI